ncbi:iron-containing alcohol dehydrogenase [Candidatus Aerophobetes bacterium]|uniref:Iron-containing alcohol dehydrogenase n=1 Tax=Aerophobetes bacterium TaxID=2030807 RepID=A0A523QML4_UNCAE|nr:MAG: iron-containing alcohol dehydrogenase [Candidatus Aerophobetes bacterium]
MKQARFFRIPSGVIVGCNASSFAGREAKKLGGTKALIVTDRNLTEMGFLSGIESSLDSEKIDHEVFDEVTAEPTVDYVEKGLDLYRRSKCDFIIALGGGSPIDTAKAVCIMASNPGVIQDYKGLDKVSSPGAPLIAIPTTAGTGSETTIFTIITDTRTNVKMLIGSPFILPSVALVDPLLTASSPPSVTAATGVDALTHAIEAYVSVKAQPMSDVFALSAIKFLSENLRQAWANGDNLEARSLTMLGAFQAGVAFSNSSVALVHGMSRPIGAYFHAPHGLSNAVLLAPVVEFSISGNPKRYADIARAMGEKVEGLGVMEGASKASKAVRELVRDIKIPALATLGVTREKLKTVVGKMADDAIASGSPGNNPRKATKEEIVELYWKTFNQDL